MNWRIILLKIYWKIWAFLINIKNIIKKLIKKNLKKLSENNLFTKFFEIKYLDLFLYYYNDEQPLEEFSKFGKTINLSGKTKSFYYVLQKYKDLK